MRSVVVGRSEEHTSELQSPCNLVCRLLLEKKKKKDSAQCSGRAVDGAASGPRACARDQRQPHARARSRRRRPTPATGRPFFFFFFNDRATPEIYTLSLHDALPICRRLLLHTKRQRQPWCCCPSCRHRL